MKLKKVTLLILLFSVSITGMFADSAWAKGLSVAPASYEWKDVKTGSKIKCPAGIAAKNNSKELRSYIMRAVKPSEIGLKPSRGYDEIPFTDWVSFGQKIVPLEPGKWKRLTLFIEIPEEKKYLGRKWEFYLEVKEYTTGLEMFTLSCQVKFLITTVKKP